MEKEPQKIDPGIFKVPLYVSDSLKKKKGGYERTILNAQRSLRAFAEKYGWGALTDEPFLKSARIFDDQGIFIRNLLEVTGAPEATELPGTVSACLENDILMSVSPELYAIIYPEGIEERSFEKLIIHEMAHRLHIRILEGDENKMGPVWFFEGFALFAAGQFEKALPLLNPVEIRKIMSDDRRGSYRKYAEMFRFFTRNFGLKDLIEKAYDPDFTIWLEKKL